MKTQSLVLGTAFLLLTVATADAQTIRLTLGEAIDRAMETSHRLAEAIAREAGARATVRVRESADRPTVSLSGGYTRTNHVEEFSVPQPPGVLQVIYPDVPDNLFSRVAMQWPIYTGGRTDALQRAAEAEARAVGADVQATRADLRLEVVRAYWALATAHESQRVLDEAVSRADADVRDVRVRFDNGLIPPNEVASAEAQRSRQQLQQIEARNLRSSALEDLRRLTGITGEIEIAEPLEAPQPPGVIASAQASPRAERQAQADRIIAADERRRAAEARTPPDGFGDRRGGLRQTQPEHLSAHRHLAGVLGARCQRQLDFVGRRPHWRRSSRSRSRRDCRPGAAGGARFTVRTRDPPAFARSRLCARIGDCRRRRCPQRGRGQTGGRRALHRRCCDQYRSARRTARSAPGGVGSHARACGNQARRGPTGSRVGEMRWRRSRSGT